MSKKVIVALLAVVMALSVFSLSVFAVGGFSDESTADLKTYNYTQTWSLSTPELVSGSTYRVKVYLQTNYLVGPVQFKLENVSGVTATLGGGYYTGSKISSNASGLVILTPSTASTLVGQKFETPTEIAVVTYTKGAQDPAIQNNPYTLTNPEGTLMAARLSGSTAVNGADLVFGQKVSIDGQTPTPPAGNVTLTGVNGGVVDETRGYVYGVPEATADPTTYFSTTGYMEMVANDSGVINGTGATLNLYTDSSKSSKVASYTLVIFGDVNGDGFVKSADAATVSSAANYITPDLQGYIAFAADLNGDGFVKSADAATLSSYANYIVPTITVNPWA